MVSERGDGRPLIIGHRGAAGEAPENTRAAVRTALEQGADGVEVDLRLTRDGRIVLMHDANTLRVTGRYRRVRRNSLARIQKLRVAPGRRFRDLRERVPTLEEVLALLPEGAVVMLEIKGEEEMLVPLKGILERAAGHLERLYLLDFRPWMLEATREVFPRDSLVWNVAFEQPGKGGVWSPDPLTLVPSARRLGVRALNVMVCEAVTRGFVEAAHDDGLEVHVWTVNEVEDAVRLAGIGVDGIVTDHPGRIWAALGADR